MAKTKADRHWLHRDLTGEGLPPVAAAFAGKVAEVNRWMLENGKPQDRVFEVHPELCFRALNGKRSVAESKHGATGLRVRYALLRPCFSGQDVDAWTKKWLRRRSKASVKEDDVLDALVACVTAATWAPEATIPGLVPPVDSCGIRMEMRCPKRTWGEYRDE
jgi:predicted RNase H-like nuclease